MKIANWIFSGSLLAMFSLLPFISFAEEITVTTYYPSPEGKYKKLETTDQTLLATDTTSATAKVGIGTTGPRVELDVAQNGAIGLWNGFFSSGLDSLTHFAFNAWFDGTVWQIPDPTKKSSIMQMWEDKIIFYFSQTPGGRDWKEGARITSSGLAGGSGIYRTGWENTNTPCSARCGGLEKCVVSEIKEEGRPLTCEWFNAAYTARCVCTS